MSQTVVYNTDGRPKVTLTRDDDDGLEAIIEVDGLEPTRDTTAEERAVGITSLDPPTVSVRDRSDRAEVLRALIDGGNRAVNASATSTLGETGGAYGMACSCYRVSSAIKAAIRMLSDPAEEI